MNIVASILILYFLVNACITKILVDNDANWKYACEKAKDGSSQSNVSANTFLRVMIFLSIVAGLPILIWSKIDKIIRRKNKPSNE